MRVVTLAGIPVQKGVLDGRGEIALFNSPYGLTLDDEGNIYTTDCYNSTVRKISIEGKVSTIAGFPGRAGFADGEAAQSLFGFPTGIVRDKKGNLFVCDNSSCTIRKIAPDGRVSTFAGVPGKKGEIDGPGRVSLLNGPQGITIDPNGNLYFTENRGLKGAAVRKISAEGIVSTILPVKEPYSFQGIAVDGKGFLVFTDMYNHVIWKLPVAGGKMTRLAGGVQNPGYTDGGGISARFNEPRDVTVDHYGNIYVTDMTNHLIRKIGTDGYVSTVAGMVQGGCADGSTTGTLGIGKFYTPLGITVDWSGIYVADHGNCTIRKIHIPFVWSPEKHNWLPRRMRQQLSTVMMLALKDPQTGEARYPEAFFHLLTKDLIYVIFVFVAAVNF